MFNQDQMPDDVRFQFEIIKELAASVREQTRHIGEMQKQIGDALIRLERIEAREHSEQIAKLEAEIELLKTDYNRRVGRDGFIASVFKSPLVAWVVFAMGAVYVALRDRL